MASFKPNETAYFRYILGKVVLSMMYQVVCHKKLHSYMTNPVQKYLKKIMDKLTMRKTSRRFCVKDIVCCSFSSDLLEAPCCCL